MKELSKTVLSFKESIFATITKEAQKQNAINLGQGFPDFSAPKWMLQKLSESYQNQNPLIQQYAPFMGTLALRQSIESLYARNYAIRFNHESEITVLNGATEAIFCTCLALLNPNDEVIIIEPFYDSYVASIELAHAKAVPVTLHLPDKQIDWKELKKAITSKTKMIILNNPHNPTGKVYSHDELAQIAQIALENDLYIMSDEVYEYLVYDGLKHIPMSSFENVRDRVITISSVGKTLGMTGLKIGWTIAHEKITKAIRLVHQYNTFAVHHPTQHALVSILDNIDDYLVDFKNTYQAKRDLFYQGLKSLNFSPLTTEGTYFMMCHVPEGKNDVDYSLELIRDFQVASIPPSCFYLKSDEGKRFIRFCFAKEDATLHSALKNLQH